MWILTPCFLHAYDVYSNRSRSLEHCGDSLMKSFNLNNAKTSQCYICIELIFFDERRQLRWMNSSPVGWLVHWWAKRFCSVWFQLWQFWAASSAPSGQWTDNQQSQNPSSLLHAQLNSECQVFWNMLHVVILITCCVYIKKSLNESLDITFLTTTALIRFIWSRDQVQSPLSMGKFLFFSSLVFALLFSSQLCVLHRSWHK